MSDKQKSVRLFQSTPPVKAATNPQKRRIHSGAISIHAAREGGDTIRMRILFKCGVFQSTPPVKAATIWDIAFLTMLGISIHAAREGGDAIVMPHVPTAKYFNPRRP